MMFYHVGINNAARHTSMANNALCGVVIKTGEVPYSLTVRHYIVETSYKYTKTHAKGFVFFNNGEDCVMCNKCSQLFIEKLLIENGLV